MKLLIAGAGGHGRVVADVAAASGRYSAIAFIDDRYPGLVLPEAWPVIGRVGDLPTLAAGFDAFIAAFGNAKIRLAALQKAIAMGLSCPPVIHPSAVVSRHATLAAGTVVMAGGIVNIGARLGPGCIVNTGATVDHDCRLAAGVHVCPGAHLAGDVSVGERTWFGIGAVSKQGLTVGADVIVGAGAVVLRDVPDGLTVVGNPAKLLPAE